MARKLKTYTTSAGFFDLALSAPSMKAALEAWGATFNLFQRDMAHQTEDPEIVAATMEKPGVVLRRQVGTREPYTEHAELRADASAAPRKRVAQREGRSRRRTGATPSKDTAADREAARAFKREELRRKRQDRKEEANRQKQNERQSQAVEAARGSLAEAERKHDKMLKEIRRGQAVLEKRHAREEARWRDEKRRLSEALRAAASGHLRLVR